MYMKHCFKKLIIITIFLTLTGCACKNESIFRDIHRQPGHVSYLAITENGEVTLRNARTGEVIPPCIQQTGSEQNTPEYSNREESCKTRIEERDGTVVVIIKDEAGRDIVKEPKYSIVHRVVGYEGSHCETHEVGGNQYEECWPW
ncbi:MAG: hypothetical protein V3U75_09415 [Methylococcaceae bacterium]